MSPNLTRQTPEGGDVGAAVVCLLHRLEAKVDVVLARQTVTIEQHQDALGDHEERIRKLEGKPTVSPRELWTALGSAVAVASAVLAMLDRVSPGR